MTLNNRLLHLYCNLPSLKPAVYCLAAVLLSANLLHFTVAAPRIQIRISGPCSLSTNVSSNSLQPKCGSNAYCQRLFAGCRQGLCTCRGGRFAPSPSAPSNCASILRVGQLCTKANTHSWILPDFALCIDNKVQCIQNFKESDGDCIPTAAVGSQPGQPCEPKVGCNPFSGLVCAVTEAMRAPNSTYLTTTKCMCPNNLIFREGFCRPAIYGDPCTSDIECSTVLPGSGKCLPEVKRCVCNIGFTSVPAFVTLQPRSSQQILAFMCIPSTSKPRAKEGEDCTVPHKYNPRDKMPMIHCENNLACIHCPEMMPGPPSRGVCQYYTNAKVLNSDFWPSHPPQRVLSLSSACDAQSRRCGRNAGCLLDSPESPCQKGSCLCRNDSFVPSKENTADCQKKLQVGAQCRYGDEHLLPDYATCVNHIVTCDGLLKPNRKGACSLPLGYGDFGDFCNGVLFSCNFLLGLICGNATSTIERTVYGPVFCRCPDDQIYKDGRCRKALFSDECWNDRQCSAAYGTAPAHSPSWCNDGRCSCKPGYYHSSFKTGTYCISIRLLTKDLREPCLASPKLSELKSTIDAFCRPGLRCWHCAEHNRDTSAGRCYPDAMIDRVISKDTRSRPTPINYQDQKLIIVAPNSAVSLKMPPLLRTAIYSLVIAVVSKLRYSF